MPKLYRLSEVQELVSMSRSQIYREMDAGRLAYIQHGRVRLFEESAVDAFVDELRAGSTAARVERLLALVDEHGRIDLTTIPEGTTLADLEAAKRVVAERPDVA